MDSEIRCIYCGSERVFQIGYVTPKDGKLGLLMKCFRGYIFKAYKGDKYWMVEEIANNESINKGE